MIFPKFCGWEIFENLEFFFRKLLKCIILAYVFSNNFKKCVNFLRAWTKNTNCWKFLRKFNRKIEYIYIYIWKVDTKNRDFGNSIIFLQQFSHFGAFPPSSHGYASDFSYNPLEILKKMQEIYIDFLVLLRKSKKSENI